MVRSYEGEATLILGEQSFEVTCSIDEGYTRPDAPIMGSRARLGGQVPWGGYFRLIEPNRESEFVAGQSEYPTATLRLSDGREATVAIHGDTLYSSDGHWPA